MQTTSNKLQILKSLLWGTFAGTATLCAFILLLFILTPNSFAIALPPWAFVTTSIIILFSALYHSIYRIIASNHDLKLVKKLIISIGFLSLLIIILEIIPQ